MIQLIRDIFSSARLAGRPVVSFEFFPTKTEDGERALLEKTIPALRELHPDFCSVTYGAGGGTREKTLGIVDRIQREQSITAMAHLTCVNATIDDTCAVLDQTRALGIKNVLALRGDPPRGETTFTPTAGGFAHGAELAAFINGRWDVCILSAAYPEKHPESTDWDTELRNLKRKTDHGAQVLITQLFFEAATYFAFVERARAAGITVPIVPGIMPITNVSQIERFTTMCGATIPAALRDLLSGVRDDEDAVSAIGIEWASDQCRALVQGGAPGLHFFTLNRSHSTQEIVGLLRVNGHV